MRHLMTAVAIAALALTTACAGAQKKADDTAKAGGPAADKLPDSATCPVMKKDFKPTAKTAKTTHKGKTYYFCCPGCDKKFAANPDKYLAAGPAAAATPDAKKGCAGDCADGCADCKNPNKEATKEAKADNGVKMTTGAEMGDKLAKKAKCVVSGREFEPSATTPVAMYQGKTHYFCCGGCAGKFAANPAKFAAK
jgi:P-type Cu+ transporter